MRYVTGCHRAYRDTDHPDLMDPVEERLDMLEKRFNELCLFVYSGARVNPSGMAFYDEDEAPTSTLRKLVSRSGCSLHHHPTTQHSALLLPGHKGPPWSDTQLRGPTSKKMQLPRAVDLVEGRWPGEEEPVPKELGYKWFWQD